MFLILANILFTKYRITLADFFLLTAAQNEKRHKHEKAILSGGAFRLFCYAQWAKIIFLFPLQVPKSPFTQPCNFGHLLFCLIFNLCNYKVGVQSRNEMEIRAKIGFLPTVL